MLTLSSRMDKYRFQLEDQLGIARKPSSASQSGSGQPGSLSLDRRSDSSLESKVSSMSNEVAGGPTSGQDKASESGLGSSVKTLSTVSSATDLNRQIKNIDLNSEVSRIEAKSCFQVALTACYK